MTLVLIEATSIEALGGAFLGTDAWASTDS